MKRDIDSGQNLNLCLDLEKVEFEVGNDVLASIPGHKAHGDMGKIVYVSQKGRPVVQWEDDSDVIVYKSLSSGSLSSGSLGSGIKLAPLCWVEGKPVYVGDTLYRKDVGDPMVVAYYGSSPEGSRYDDGGDYLFGTGLFYASGEPIQLHSSGMEAKSMTWKKPVKIVKKSGWLNIYDRTACALHPTRGEAEYMAGRDRKACIEVHWEEQE